MADPRFFSVAGPFSLAALAEFADAELADGVDGGKWIVDIAALDDAGGDDHQVALDGAAVGEHPARTLGVDLEVRYPAAQHGAALVGEVAGQDLGQAQGVHRAPHLGHEEGVLDRGAEGRFHLARLLPAQLLHLDTAAAAQIQRVGGLGQGLLGLEDVKHAVALHHVLGAGLGEQGLEAVVHARQESIAGIGGLFDPVFGAATALRGNHILGTQGFLVSLEATGYTDSEGDRVTAVAEGWSVAKIKRIGPSAVKILLYYNPGSATAEQQEAFIVQAAEDCRVHDIPMLVEPMTYHIVDGPKKGTAEFAALKPDMVIETARRLCPLGIDVLKAEFPDDPDFEKDEAKMADHCRQLTETAEVPWVLLSAGVDYDTFNLQTRLACENGASGFLAGRAIWQEAPGLPEAEQAEFLTSTAVARLKDLTSIANSNGRPWAGVSSGLIEAIDVAEGWQARY